MSNLNPQEDGSGKPKGIQEIGKLPSPPKTETGKFFTAFQGFKRERVPEHLLDLFDWCKALDTRKIDYLLELKNMSTVLKATVMKSLIKKLETGEVLDTKELNTMKLIKDLLVESHKLKYGDRKVIEHIVSQTDIIQHMRKQVVEVEAEVLDDNRGDN